MALIKCSNCGKEISESAERYVHCGQKCTSSKSLEEQNVSFLLNFAKIVYWICFAAAIISLILSFSYGIGGLILCIVFVLQGYFFNYAIQNKALVLKNIHEINKKLKNK